VLSPVGDDIRTSASQRLLGELAAFGVHNGYALLSCVQIDPSRLLVPTKKARAKEAEMKIVGCHPRLNTTVIADAVQDAGL
jgi:hypothetical protein